jgi:hypothetical protein
MLTIGLTAYARRTCVLWPYLQFQQYSKLRSQYMYEEGEESKQHLDVVVYTMSSVEGSLDEKAGAPMTEENAESPLLAATLPAESTEDEALCPCQKAYRESGNEKKVLYLMCIGLQCNDVPLFSFETIPWSLLPKTSLHPKNTDPSPN